MRWALGTTHQPGCRVEAWKNQREFVEPLLASDFLYMVIIRKAYCKLPILPCIVFWGTMVKKKHEMMRSPYEPAVMGPRIARVFWPQGIKVLLTLGVRHQVSRVTLGLVVMLVLHIMIIIYPPWNQQFAPENGWLEYDRFLLGPGQLSGAKQVNLERFVFAALTPGPWGWKLGMVVCGQLGVVAGDLRI